MSAAQTDSPGAADSRHLVERTQGEYIFRQGEDGAEMYIVRAGKVEIMTDTVEGRRRLAVLERGDFFGEMSLLEDLPRSATARAMTPLTLVRVDRHTFDRMLRSDPEIAVRIMRKLSRRLREADRLLGNRPRLGEPGLTSRFEPHGAVSPYRLVHRESGHEFPLAAKGEATVGRGDPVTGIRPEIDLVDVDRDRSASRRHAKIYREGSQFYLVEDIGTTNGTFRNGRRLQSGIPVAISSGDHLRFGLVELELLIDQP